MTLTSAARRIVSRLAVGIPILLIVTFLTFILLYGIGNPAASLIGDNASRGEVALVQHQFGFDRPVVVQYLSWLGNALHGNLGNSFESSGQPVTQLLSQTLPTTLFLAVGAMGIAIIFSIVAGFVAGLFPDSPIDWAVRGFAVMGIAIPPIFVALLISVFVGVQLKWLPPSGYVPLSEGLGPWSAHMVLPWISLSLGLLAQQARTLRSSLAKEMRADYVRTARAKGTPEPVILFRHVARNASLPLVNVVGLQVPRLITGAVFVEFVFGLPGIGSLTITSVMAQDFPTVQAIVTIVVVATLVANLVVDLASEVLRPTVAEHERA